MAKVMKDKMLKKGKNKLQKIKKGKKEVCEIFDIEKNGREKTIESCGAGEVKKGHITKTLMEKEKRQLFCIIAAMAVILISFFLVYAISQQSKRFEYNGFNFEKIMYDKLPLYYTKISITRADSNIINYNLYLRDDPRKKNIKPDAFVHFMRGDIFISLNKDFEKCDDTSLAMTNIGMLFGAIGLDLKAALDNLEQAEMLKRPYATCENTKNNTVILYKMANETGIKQQENCYIINVADCEILNATEAFIMQTLSDMKRKQ